MANSRYILNLCGIDCAIEEYGSAQGYPVVALHGWLDNLASFYSLTPYFKDYRLILLDFPGHGLSKHLPQGMANHLSDLVYVLQDLISALSLKHYSIIGHSMGGAAAMMFACAAPTMDRLILLESLGALTEPAETSVDLLLQSLAARQALNHKSKPIYPDIESALSVRAHASHIDAEQIRPIVERGLMQVEKGFSWRSDARLRNRHLMRFTEKQIEYLIQGITCPVLLIEADNGLLSKNTEMQQRKTFFKQLSQHMLPGGHHIHLEKTQETAELIIDYLNQI